MHHQCLPVLGMNILKETFSNLTLCANVEESTNNFILLTHIIQNGLENNLEKCKLPCNQDLVSSSSSILNVVGMSLLGVKVRNMKMDFNTGGTWGRRHLGSGRAMNTNDENL